MNVIVGGNCQGITLAEQCALMNPALVVERVPWVTGDPPVVRDDAIVFWQIGEGRERPERAPANVFFWPDLTFRAFHPDQAYVSTEACAVKSPIGHYHSMLVLQGWLRGRSVAQTRRLFCPEVFAEAGYFMDRALARAQFLERTSRSGADLVGAFASWEQRGCFMHSTNRPKAVAIASVARDLLERAGIDIRLDDPDTYVADPLLAYDTWPVYPEIAHHLGVDGAYLFKSRKSAEQIVPELFDLERFIAGSFAQYALHAREALVCHQAKNIDWRFLDTRAGPRLAVRSPYADLPDERFWRRAVQKVAPRNVDPAAGVALPINRTSRIASVGSCFAQHIGRALVRNGFNFIEAEGSQSESVTSARFGNVYTARGLRQLFERAFGTRVPDDVAWQRKDGRYVDPFRPQIEPLGYEDPLAVIAAWSAHYAAVRAMFESLEVLVVTLGLTEEWYARADGSVFPVAPGVIENAYDPARYGFRNARVADVVSDLGAFLASLRAVNRHARVVFTVSPQAPIATFESRHVQVSASVTKATLRAAVDAIENAHANVWYFPSYEIVTGAQNRGIFFDDDARNVNARGVEHVMQSFFAHCESDHGQAAAPGERARPIAVPYDPDMAVVCDEELIG